MRSRLLVPLSIVALVGCSGAPPSPPPTPSPEPSATPWSEPFRAHLDEYLNPAWTSLTVVAREGCMRPEDLELEGYINGKLIVVSVDKRELMRSYGSLNPATNDPDEPGPPDWGLPWAQTPEEVGTVVLVWASPIDPLTVGGTYRKGEALGVRVVDFERKEVVSEGVVYPGFAMGPSGEERDASPWAYLTGALRSRLFAAPFQAHLPEYLDKAWLGDPSDDVDILAFVEGHIRGGLLVVSADTGELLRPSFAESLYGETKISGAVAPGPPDWGLRWAETPEDVGTVLLVWPRRVRTTGTFTDGAAGYFEFPKVKLVDLELREVIGEWWNVGDDPGTVKFCSGPITGRSPWADLMADLRGLPSSD